MKKITVADVILWGKRIGAISWNEDQNLGTFEYDASFLSAKNIELSTWPDKDGRFNGYGVGGFLH